MPFASGTIVYNYISLENNLTIVIKVIKEGLGTKIVLFR